MMNPANDDQLELEEKASTGTNTLTRVDTGSGKNSVALQCYRTGELNQNYNTFLSSMQHPVTYARYKSPTFRFYIHL